VTNTPTNVVPPTATPTEQPYLRGDANCDGDVNIADILFVADVIFDRDGAALSDQGYRNLGLEPGDEVSIEQILFIADVIFDR